MPLRNAPSPAHGRPLAERIAGADGPTSKYVTVMTAAAAVWTALCWMSGVTSRGQWPELSSRRVAGLVSWSAVLAGALAVASGSCRTRHPTAEHAVWPRMTAGVAHPTGVMPLVRSNDVVLVYPARPAAARSAVALGRIRDSRNPRPYE
jgi:hypothetical protein